MSLLEGVNVLHQIYKNTYFRTEIVWKNVIGFAILHAAGIYGTYLLFSGQAMWLTTFWSIFVGYIGCECTTIGAHRMWTHKSFQGTPALKLFLAIGNTIAGQNCIWIWARDHRLHHKYSDTDADPHSAARGFFFSHIGWLMLKKLPAVTTTGRTIDMSDLKADPYIMFQKKYYYELYFIFSFLIPAIVPVYCWGESLKIGVFVCFFARYVLSLHGTWSINSVAHLYGTKPYTKDMLPGEAEYVSLITLGEGWHNFHHTFPWDYRAAEFGMHYNITSTFIDWLEALGLASNLRCVTNKMLEHRVNKNGDGTHRLFTNNFFEEEIKFKKENPHG